MFFGFHRQYIVIWGGGCVTDKWTALGQELPNGRASWHGDCWGYSGSLWSKIVTELFKRKFPSASRICLMVWTCCGASGRIWPTDLPLFQGAGERFRGTNHLSLSNSLARKRTLAQSLIPPQGANGAEMPGFWGGEKCSLIPEANVFLSPRSGRIALTLLGSAGAGPCSARGRSVPALRAARATAATCQRR